LLWEQFAYPAEDQMPGTTSNTACNMQIGTQHPAVSYNAHTEHKHNTMAMIPPLQRRLLS